MPDDYVCPDCNEPHDGPGTCSICGTAYINLSGFDLDEKASHSEEYSDSDVADTDSAPEAA